MDFKLVIKSVKEICRNSPILVVVILLACCVSVFIMIDAHRSKKKRSRHRWK
jgi:hypothetical protein